MAAAFVPSELSHGRRYLIKTTSELEATEPRPVDLEQGSLG